MSIANSNTFSESSEIHLNESKWLEEYKNIVRKKQLKQGKIKLELTSLSNVGGVYSSIVRIQNFAWGIGADIKSKANKEFLVIGIRCVPRTSSHLWSCLTELGIRIKNYTDRGKDIVKFINHEFDCNNNCFGIYFVEKEILESGKNGYYQDGKIIIEVQLKIYYTTGYIEQPVYDFTEFGANGNNTVLKINGNQIFVNKHYLALYSQYFENLFISNNEEPNNNIYLLENLRIADFIELLEAIYPSQKKVTEKNVKVLLELSDRFIIPSLYNKCENFLIVTKKMEWVEKIVLAERYCLSKLYEFCMGQINNVTTIKRISTSKLYNEMTMEAKVDLLNKMLELSYDFSNKKFQGSIVLIFEKLDEGSLYESHSLLNLTFCSDTQTNILNEKQWFDEYKKKIQLQEQKEGTLKIEVSDLSFLDNTITEYVSIQNILWSLSFDFKYSLENDDDVLIGTIVCNPKISSYSWVCKAAVEIRIKNSFNKCNAIIKKHYHYFSYDNDTINIHLTEKKILSNKNYSNINKFIIEAKVEIIEISGTMEKKIYDFTIPGNESNAAFNIKGNILYVNKEYLSLYSPVMKRMFMLTTDKPIKNTVMLENINIIYFVELLNVLYPYHKGVSERNINYLLEMAEFFEISYLFKECEDFLIRTEKISRENKIILAEKYKFSKLHNLCMEEIESLSDIIKIGSSIHYHEMSKDTKAVILDKMFRLIKS